MKRVLEAEGKNDEIEHGGVTVPGWPPMRKRFLGDGAWSG